MNGEHEMTLDKKSIVFISTMGRTPWGGSEELWSRAALDLSAKGFTVSASVHGWAPLHERMLALKWHGVDVWPRPPEHLWALAWRKVFAGDKTSIMTAAAKLISAKRPALTVLSDGANLPPIGLIESCVAKEQPFVTVSQANSDGWWFDDRTADRYRKVLPFAHRCYFVSEANRLLAEKQIGCDIPNAEVVWNPVNVDINASPRWPLLDELRLACVAALHLASKGHDVLLEALADPSWASRPWRLRLYGAGENRDTLGRLVQRLGLQNRVSFAGHVASVEKIWAENHVLVMPSRYEGLPLAMVEALLCGRPVVATNVAGHAEIIDDGVTGFLADAPVASLFRRALERLWERRSELEDMGRAAAKSIRGKIPVDPGRTFSEKIQRLI